MVLAVVLAAANVLIYFLSNYYAIEEDIMAEERLKSKALIGKILVSEESGKKFGMIGDIDYITESGELINLVLVEPTPHTNTLNLQKDERGRILVPFSSVKSVGDFVIIAEKDIL